MTITAGFKVNLSMGVNMATYFPGVHEQVVSDNICVHYKSKRLSPAEVKGMQPQVLKACPIRHEASQLRHPRHRSYKAECKKLEGLTCMVWQRDQVGRICRWVGIAVVTIPIALASPASG